MLTGPKIDSSERVYFRREIIQTSVVGGQPKQWLLFHRDLLNAIASGTSLAEEIENRYEVEKGEELQLNRRLQQLEESLASKRADLTTFRKLLRKELQENTESPKPALHALIERITAYPDRKKEVNFRIGEKSERNSWGTRSVPPRVAIPRRGT